MPCEEIIQVVGTLVPQDKESFGSVTSHEGNAIFIFEESRTLLSNQGEFLNMTQKQQSFRKEPLYLKKFSLLMANKTEPALRISFARFSL
ncbi:hypothetical protein ACTWQL_13545 [Pseudalkalibacillus sp. R45]|uniref:hypothetical protein n=1 Tax=Pseudalkalibacillus sp. R45 TaxID=3457433 RepID=UPI003FCC9694